MGDGAEYLKYVTERVIAYWQQPQAAPEVRRERRNRREPWVSRWFGQLLPVGIAVWWRQRAAEAWHESGVELSVLLQRFERDEPRADHIDGQVQPAAVGAQKADDRYGV